MRLKSSEPKRRPAVGGVLAGVARIRVPHVQQRDLPAHVGDDTNGEHEADCLGAGEVSLLALLRRAVAAPQGGRDSRRRLASRSRDAATRTTAAAAPSVRSRSAPPARGAPRGNGAGQIQRLKSGQLKYRQFKSGRLGPWQLAAVLHLAASWCMQCRYYISLVRCLMHELVHLWTRTPPLSTSCAIPSFPAEQI